MITLNADSVISEVWESPLYTRQQAELLSALSSEAIDIAINMSATDDFWHAYDELRNRVIDLLLSKIGVPTEMFPIIENCRECGRETIHQDIAGERVCGKCGTVTTSGSTR